ncbi:phosphate acetyltransferase [Lactobacillus sp. ESL0791]|uniref:phosphate acetyltransferase n=1 Tax=Lactobacillus sp. ESL0791 TaxID=2983234 RepID=UPI0023F67B79|nr:phosphate acetyltransferase [Lactobacillus sp. ESL0791]MDF7638635.1 phosphate acetyltransferase [Lactobacillus sp. ESL0791]
MSVFDLLKKQVEKADKKPRIVFPEGEDRRILQAASRLQAEGLIEAIILGVPTKVRALAEAAGIDLTGIQIVDFLNYPGIDQMAAAFIAARNKDISLEEAKKQLESAAYFGTMYVKLGKADGMVAGAAHSTADTVRPALQLIHTASGMHRVSGSFIMERGADKYVFADCAINIEPDAETLVEIAYQSVQTAKMINLEPRLAFLSFSTKGSAKGEMVTKVAEAAALFKQRYPQILADGELQFDAAFVPEVAQSKAPDSEIKGQANIFIFPELQSGNIAYKLTQRLGGFTAVGPILQGLAAPINDLSRGASSQDVYDMALLTAAQSLQGDYNETGN